MTKIFKLLKINVCSLILSYITKDFFHLSYHKKENLNGLRKWYIYKQVVT